MTKWALLRGVLMVAASTAAGRGSVVISGIIAANYLGAHAFTMLAFAHVTASAASNIGMFGLLNGLPRLCAGLDVNPTAGNAISILAALAAAVVGLLLAALIVLVLPAGLMGIKAPNYQQVLALLTLALGASNILAAIATGFNCNARLARSSLVMAVFLLSAAVIAANTGSVNVLLGGYILSLLIQCGLLYPIFNSKVLRQLPSKRITFGVPEMRRLQKMALPLFGMSILLNSGIWLAGRSLLSDELPSVGYALFGVGMQWFGLAAIGSIVVGKVLAPALTKSIALNDTDQRTMAIGIGVRISLVSSALILAIAVVASPLITRLYGEALAGVELIIALYVGAAVLSSPISTVSSELIARDRFRDIFIAVGVWWCALVAMVFSSNQGSPAWVGFSLCISYAVYLSISIVAVLSARKLEPERVKR